MVLLKDLSCRSDWVSEIALVTRQPYQLKFMWLEFSTAKCSHNSRTSSEYWPCSSLSISWSVHLHCFVIDIVDPPSFLRALNQVQWWAQGSGQVWSRQKYTRFSQQGEKSYSASRWRTSKCSYRLSGDWDM